ncbi:MAG TPA: glutamate formimidoyltransferase, partial [Chitinophagaceae bacterium]|nr:glutamate formimidoyltransferase [Chitinophagaceae bacterium]
FSEGADPAGIAKITAAVESVEGVQLLGVDSGKATNRTVVTFVGAPEAVVEAAFRAICQASLVIDMTRHRGEHPRLGATDVCPLIPVSGITMEEAVGYARQLGKRVAEELHIPVYLYGNAARQVERKNLSNIRSGQYEGLASKLADPAWAPDFGEPVFNPQSGATVIGARDFLIAYNINLNTRSVRKANAVAFDVRENGRVRKERGKPVLDDTGHPERIPGSLREVKAIGWFIEEYGIAQVSMNLTNLEVTPLHVAFEETTRKAAERGLRVTGSELVGMIPLRCLVEAGKYFLKKQHQSAGASETELVRMAVRSLGLDQLTPFDPSRKVIEYALAAGRPADLSRLSLRDFLDELASESPAPGGGSVAALLGALGASLGTMVANLSAGRKGWEDRLEEFSGWAEKGQQLKDQMLALIQRDTDAFQQILQARALPREDPDQRSAREQAIESATEASILVPLQVMQLSSGCFDLIDQMATQGNPHAVSDAGVAALCARAAIQGAFFNVQINAATFTEKFKASAWLSQAEALLEEALVREKHILAQVSHRINYP